MNQLTQRSQTAQRDFSSRGDSSSSLPRWLWQTDRMLVLVCILAAVPSVYLALTQFVEYDGFWHVFVAQQDHWKNFWFDYKENDHPPLIYLLIKLMLHLGRSIFVYRSIPLLSALASIYLVGKISQKLSLSSITPVLTALAFGLSMATIELSVSVRSYMLSIAFVLLAFYYLLDLLSPSLEHRARVRILFALSLILAVSSHYVTFFYVAACSVILAGTLLLRWSSVSLRSLLADGLALVPVAAVMAYFYRTHIRLHAASIEDYLADYFYRGPESKAAYVVRNLQNAFNFLAPLQIPNRIVFLIVAATLALIGIGVLICVRSRAVAPLVMFLTLLGGLAWAGLHGKYPFGGLLRQQYILFPFAILSAGVAFDHVLTMVRVRRFAAGVAVGAAVLIISVSVYRWETYPKVTRPLFTSEMERFHAAVPEPRAVLLDQFNLIGFFIHHHQWRWRFDQRLPMATAVDQYTVERDGNPFIVLRDRTRWNFDFTDPAFFQDIGQSMRAAGLSSLAVFCVHQFSKAITPDQQNALRLTVVRLAGAANLQLGSFVLDGLNVYAQFEKTSSDGIHAFSATYGGNCGAPAGNATIDFKAQCQDAKTCTYVVDALALRDPKPGCLKDFQASWTCGTKSQVHTASVPAEAGFRSKVLIACPATE